MAPVAGTVLPPPLTPRREENDEKLPAWSGTPLDRENLGALLEQGVLFCQVGDPKRLEAVLVVDQADRNLVREGQSVDIKLEGFPSTTLHSKITEIAESELKVTPQRLSTKSGGELPTKTDPHTGVEKPMSTSYQARVPIDDPDGLIRLGLRGQARVYTDWLSLGRPPLAAGEPHVQLQDVAELVNHCVTVRGRVGDWSIFRLESVFCKQRRWPKTWTCLLPRREPDPAQPRHFLPSATRAADSWPGRRWILCPLSLRERARVRATGLGNVRRRPSPEAASNRSPLARTLFARDD